jgi:ethanolamine ammonia-lyase small subunit
LVELQTLLPQEKPLLLHSAAPDRNTYLQRPDLGRRLDELSRQRLQQRPSHYAYDLQIVIVDGLSSVAVDRHAVPLLTELLPSLANSSPSLTLAPICVVQQGRVAIGDEIAQALSARMVIVLIGERPGLSSPDSLGAYITWEPRPGLTTDAERNCISNIRTEGLSYRDAAARLSFYIREAMDKQTTGIALKDPNLSHEPSQLKSGESA